MAPTGIVHLEDPIHELNTDAHQNAGNEADDRRADRVDESAGSRDGHQTRQQSISSHRSIGLPVPYPHVEDRTK